MKQKRQFPKNLIFPHVSFVILLAIACTLALSFVFTGELDAGSFVCCCIYTLSTYALFLVIVRIVLLCKRAKLRLHKIPFYVLYRSNPDYRVKVSVHISFALTVIYCFIKGTAGIYYRSAWFGSMAFYYIVLGFVRYLILKHIRTSPIKEQEVYKKYRLCGYLLLVLTLALGAMSFHAIYYNKVIEYPGFMIYAAAAFTFYSLTTAIIDFLRCRGLNNPIFSAARTYALANALVSLFFLQCSMFSAFGDGGSWQRYMNIGTGAFVFLFLVIMALSMIYSGSKALSLIKRPLLNKER